MSKQTSIITLKGTLNGISFYKMEGENLARLANGPSKEQIENDQNFQRTRENNAEFGGSATVAKALRIALITLVKNVADSRVISRLTQVMKKINANGTGPRGQRSIELLPNKAALLGFEFNRRTGFTSVFNAPYTFAFTANRNACSIDVDGFIPGNYINAPSGATHFRLFAGMAVISKYDYNAETKIYEPFDPQFNGFNAVTFSDYTALNSTTPVSFNLNTILVGASVIDADYSVVHVIGIEFYQQIAGVNYVLAQGNAMKVINVF